MKPCGYFFFASTAVALIVGVLTLSTQSDKVIVAWHTLSPVGTIDEHLWLLKLLLLHPHPRPRPLLQLLLLLLCPRLRLLLLLLLQPRQRLRRLLHPPSPAARL